MIPTPVEFWTLNNTLTGINGNTLVSPDGAEHYVDGKIGQGWESGGLQSCVATQSPTTINPGSEDWTISCWVLDSSQGAGTNQYIWGITEAAGTPGRIRLRQNYTLDGVTKTNMYFAVWITLASGTNNGWNFPVVAAVDGWRHLVVRWASGALDLFVDGVNYSFSVFPAGYPILADAPRLAIGSGRTTDSVWGQAVDAWGYWASALSTDEIAELYNSGLGWEPSVSSVITNILHGSTPETSRILRSRIVQGIV